MTLEEALRCLGATRVIWIDDHFNDTPEALVPMLLNNAEVTRSCGIEALEASLALVDDDPDEARVLAIEALSEMSLQERTSIRDAVYRKQQEAGETPYLEMSVESVERTREMLAIADADCWSFEGVEQRIGRVYEEDDDGVAYIVDLRELRGPGTDDFRGLEVLKVLNKMGSGATAFILTHEASAEREAEHERILHGHLTKEEAVNIPLCVISKERLKGEAEGGAGMAEALRVAIKRAGLRRSVHEVLRRARDQVAASCAAAADGLLRVSPEHLDEHVVEVGYREGVSELHVIERALTAHIAQGLRRMFGNDGDVQRSNDRLRSLRAIPLDMRASELDTALAEFHKAEVWEDADLLNAAHAPIACGEVFETDLEEKGTGDAARKMFVLLAQPCDVALRPDGKRAVETGVLVPIKVAEQSKASTEKDYKLPFQMDGKTFFCHLREAVPVRLSLLDLASYRSDGRVRIDRDPESATGLLPGLTKVHPARTKPFLELMADAGQAPNVEARKVIVNMVQEDLQLLLAASDTFKHVRRGTYEPSGSVTLKGGKTFTEKPERVTWRLRRCGRVRMPYAADLLDRYVSTVNRPAFEIDYAARGVEATEPVANVGSAETAAR